MNEGEKMCSVCRKELRGTSEPYDVIELCSECGENPVVPGQELCAYCLKEFARRNADSSDDVVPDPVAIEIDAIDSVSTMDEIEIDLGDDMGEEPFDDEVFDDEEVPEEDGEELPEDEDDIVED